MGLRALEHLLLAFAAPLAWSWSTFGAEQAALAPEL